MLLIGNSVTGNVYPKRGTAAMPRLAPISVTPISVEIFVTFLLQTTLYQP